MPYSGAVCSSPPAVVAPEKGKFMSDVINSIFGRANSGTTTPGGYAGPQSETGSETVDTAVAPEIVDTEAIEESPADTTEPAEDAAETETRDETDDEADTAEADEDLEDEAVTEEADEAEADEDTAVEEDTAADEDADDTDSVDTESDEEVAEETDTAENTVEAPAVVVEADVVDEAERVVAAAARPAAGTRGATTIGDDVVTKIVVRVARKADGVHELSSEGVEVAVDDQIATITISLVIEFGHAVKALAEKVRTDVIEAVEQFLGLDVEGVDVHIADIYFPDAD